MMELELELPARRCSVALVAARFNHFVVEQLVKGASDALRTHGVAEEDCLLAWVPGAFELPLAADRLAATGRYDAIVALGAVIRGGTPHFDYVAGECSRGLTRVSLDHGIPVVFGVLTTDTLEQAVERADESEGNKGFDVALAALQMIGLIDRVGVSAKPGSPE